jgi:hypothetical protein
MPNDRWIRRNFGKSHFSAILVLVGRRRPFHRGMDVACVLEKNAGETKIMHIFTKVGKKCYEKIDPMFLFTVTTCKNRDLIMHV